jgi:6-phosphogluconolactonase (cycloisomerase 2 family)
LLARKRQSIQQNMEIKSRMSSRFAWLLGVGLLVAIGALVACGTSYNSSSDGLVVVTSQGSGLLETFSFSLTSGHSATVSNSPNDTSSEVCVLGSLPSSVIMNPAGTYAFAILTQNQTFCGTSSPTGIQAFKVNSDGTIATSGSLVADPNPIALAMDSTGTFLFVAEGLNSVPGSTLPNAAPCPGTTAQYGVCVYAINGASLTPVPGSFTFDLPPSFQTPNIGAIAVTPTTFPGIGVNSVQGAICSVPGNNPPAGEYLYATDSVNNVVYEYQVTPSTGVLTNPPSTTSVQEFLTGSVPSGVAVDPCYRFVYVSDQGPSNNVSAYTICNGLPTQSAKNCAPTGNLPAGGLSPVMGSPFSLTTGNQPGPILVDPFGNYVYTLDVSSQISIFKIGQVSGMLTANGVAATGLQGTGAQQVSMVIRGDDNWMFVVNFQAATVSQYSITPASGALTPFPTIPTDNYPSGVAVK